MLVDQAIENVRSFAIAKGWSRWKLATEAGLHQNTLRYFDREDWNPRVETLRKLEAIAEGEAA